MFKSILDLLNSISDSMSSPFRFYKKKIKRSDIVPILHICLLNNWECEEMGKDSNLQWDEAKFWINANERIVAVAGAQNHQMDRTNSAGEKLKNLKFDIFLMKKINMCS